ncbi:hypothetical protein M436DRAFT_67452 [Aureobasidium namibiae CBS 147.97]|uniref:Uncharacterized protein n=1 Tax=Aureobasidium namibiae CBS 147.97 TaxID=1043004 RepID=A0A074X459_9PEZI
MYPSPPSVAFEPEHEPVWHLKERVVLTWQNEHNQAMHLGEPSPLNKDASLVLWLGLDSNQAVVMLQLTVTHYTKGKRKKFDIFSVPESLKLDSNEISVLGIDDIAEDISRMFEAIEGSSKSRFLRLSLSKTIPSQTLMPIRKTARAVQGAAEHVMLSMQALAKSAERFEVHMGYSTYAHQALTRNIHTLGSNYTIPSFDLQSSYSHNGGAFDLWDDYLDTESARTATNAGVDLDHRHAHKRRRARSQQGEEEEQYGEDEGPQAKRQGPRAAVDDAPPPAYEQVQVPASDCAATPRSVKCRDGSSIVPTTPLNQSSCAASSFSLDPLDTPDSPPLGPPFSPRVGPSQRPPLLLDTQPIPLTNGRLDINVALHKAFVNWLCSMERLRPYLHEDHELYTMLVAYGLAVQRGDITRFPNIKARATSLVLKQHVSSTSEVRNWDLPAEKLVQRLVRWMCGLVLHADEELIDDLLLLTRRAVELTLDGDRSSAVLDTTKRDEFLLQEATCVARFFVTYAQHLSRQLKS